MSVTEHKLNVSLASVLRRRSLFIWVVCCLLAGAVFLVYASTSLAGGRGAFLLPLDDVYIHFQYAKQLAAGQPYVYNPGLPPTSGATSFLYPYVLAAGYLLGFQGLNLSLWAMVVGALALAASIWLMYRIGQVWGVPDWLALSLAVIFGLSGPVSWHFMSGMETGIVIFLALWTLYAVSRCAFRGSILAATLLALIRPEAGLLALLTVPVIFWESRPLRRRHIWLLLPIVAIGGQPLVNLLMTGSAVASGNAAKSVLGTVPFYWDEAIGRIFGQFVRMWRELISGVSSREGLYILFTIPAFGLLGLGRLLLRRDRRALGLMLVGWLLVGTMAVATLDTAFWHFKRYQMPLLILTFPLAAYGLALMLRRWRVVVYGVVGLTLLAGLGTGLQFQAHFALNVDYVYRQPLQMARWLAAHTPEDAVIAVHDVGMMRYMGGRTTLDIVGLTTPGSADYWRNGPGTVAEFLLHQRPDIIASYGTGHGYGLGMVEDAGVYGELLAGFPVELDPNYNVALAAPFQGIYQPDWTAIPHAAGAVQPSIVGNYLPEEAVILDSVDVANIAQEHAADYHWSNAERLPGYPSEVRQMRFIGCDDCWMVDGGRLITGEESFELHFDDSVLPGTPILLVTRVHPMTAGTFDVYANDVFVARRWIPALPGSWLDIPTLIPGELFSNPLRIRIVADVPGGFYMPYYHTAYAGRSAVVAPPEATVSTFQDGAIALAGVTLDYQPENAQLLVALDWYTDGTAQGDYKVFIHLLDESGAIRGQADGRPGGGTLPPGNWLPGGFQDTFVVNLAETPAGQYRVVMGLYDPVSGTRLAPQGGDDQQRLLLGEVEIAGDE
ncbi:MAG: hypothetical protein H6672_19410 [Anaerolineaceae bacterium]|nr:hypothetical protein [Anaerolineaceae bacterium]